MKKKKSSVNESPQQLSRGQAYLKILQQIGMKPAAKSRIEMAYMTTDHLRRICEALDAAKPRPAAGV